MSKFPTQIDDDVSLPPVNDNIVELGADAINACRDALFNIENYLGTGGAGTKASISERIGISLAADGTIKPSAIAGLGLVTLPITQDQISNTAAIPESKLLLDHSTQSLFNNNLVTNSTAQEAVGWISVTGIKLDPHLLGLTYRHTFDQLDISNNPNDFFKNKFRTFRDNTNGYTLFNDVNNELLAHQFADGTPFGLSPNIVTNDGSTYPSIYGHTGSGIFINTSRFVAIPQTAQDLQQFADFIDSSSLFLIGTRVQNLYSNGISRASRANSLLADGYGQPIIPVTPAIAHLLNAGANSSPFDDINAGDDIVEFKPLQADIDSNVFDEKFALVKIGDILRVNYGTIETQFIIKEKKYIQQSGNKKYIVRIAGKNLFYNPNATARIDKPLFENNKFGVLALAAANNNFSEIPSLIVGSSRGAQTLGVNFSPELFDSSHYNLYLTLYPTGNPSDGYITLPAIDVTGDKGASIGKYTLLGITESTNTAFRQQGFNYRFIAFSYQGQFGIMLADSYNNASFSIISGIVASNGNYDQTATNFNFPNNVVGIFPIGSAPDPLGFGPFSSNIASPPILTNYGSAEASQNPTKLLVPLKKNTYYVNGTEKEKLNLDIDQVLDIYGDGYWSAVINDKQIFPGSPGRVQVTYRIPFDLSSSQLKIGKTIVVQPLGEIGILDFGRFIIQGITFSDCDPEIYTDITVFDAVHAFGTSPTNTLGLNSQVAIYFNSDSVSFNQESSTDFTNISPFKRHFEVYIDQNALTFTHERARIAINTSSILVNGITINTSSNINKINFIKVSSKLRGYQFGSVNKITLNITSLDSTSGSYDGYLSSFDGTTFTHLGPVTRGKIGVITRFYDETNVDYIDLIFDFSDLPSSFTNKLLDIQLFPTLSLDEEIMLMGVCQLSDVSKTISHLRDERQFGNVSEKQLSNSAIDFINTGNKLLHTNGVIKGFDLISISDDQVFLTGGTALVDGKFIDVNNQAVIIPALQELYQSANFGINYALCVNSIGELITIPLTDFDSSLPTPNASDRIFVAINTVTSASYNLDSTTFTNLIENRRDLTILYIIPLFMSGDTPLLITQNNDARKFINQGDSVTPITWSSDTAQGNFRSFEALNNWLKFNVSFNNIVRLKGNFNITSNDNTLLMDYPNIVEFIGDGAVFNISYKTGINIGNNVKLKNIKFNYSYNALPDGTYNTNDLVNGTTGFGAIFITNHTGIFNNANKNISITECQFNYKLLDRYPIVNISIGNNTYILQNVNISDNEFNSLSTVDLSNNPFSDVRAVIAVTTNYSTFDIKSAKLINLSIEKNICNQDQMIILTASDMTSPASAIGCFINKNICGSIGFTTRFDMPQNFIGTDINFIRNKFISLSIEENSCKFIGTLNASGYTFQLSSSFASNSGKTTVRNNTLSWLQPDATFDPHDSIGMGGLSVDNNTFIPFNPSFLNNFTGPSGSATNSAYFDLGTFGSSGVVNEIEFSENNFCTGIGSNANFTTTTFNYLNHINTRNSVKVINNLFNGILADSTNASFILFNYGASGNVAIITNNKFYRKGNSISAYIKNASTSGTYTVVDNFFDSSTIDGTSAVLSNFGTATQIIYHSNINQTKKSTISMFDGEHQINAGGTDVIGLTPYFERTTPDGTLTIANASNIFDIFSGVSGNNGVYGHFHEFSTTSAGEGYKKYRKIVNLNSVLPQGVTIVEAKYGVYMVAAPSQPLGKFRYQDTNQNYFKTQLQRTLPSDTLIDVRAAIIGANDTGNDGSVFNSDISSFLFVNSAGDQTNLQNATQYSDLNTTTAGAQLTFRTGADYTVLLTMEINFSRDTANGNPLDFYVSPIEVTYRW